MLSEEYKNRIVELSGILSELSSEEIYKKYYSKINPGNFIQIVSADPTSIVEGDNIKKIGNYSKWLLSLFLKHELKLEDLYKATEYLTFFEKRKNELKNKGITLDINKYKKLSDLFSAIQPHMRKNINPPKDMEDENVFLNNDYYIENGEAERHDFSNYVMFMPKTLKASQFYGYNSEWCTTKPDMFNKYIREGSLYVFVNKSELNSDNPNRRIQVHLEAEQFMNLDDSEINRMEFLNKNKDILNFLFEKEKTHLNPKYYFVDGEKYYLIRSGWDDFSDDFRTDRNLSKDFIKDTLSGDAWQYFDNYDSNDINLEYACDDIDEKNKTEILNILISKFPNSNIDSNDNLEDILDSLNDDGEDVDDIINAIKYANSDAQRNADEGEAYEQLTNAILKHYSVISYDWKDDKLYLQIPETEFKMIVMGIVDEDGKEIDYSPPYHGFSGDIDKAYFNENLSDKIHEFKTETIEPQTVSEIRKIIRKMLEEDYRFEYKKTHIPTDSMSLAAKKAQQSVSKNNLIAQYKSGGGVVTGEKRAAKIISKTPLNHNEVRALRDLFASLGTEVSNAKSQGKTIDNSAVIQIWELNGGNAGKDWANGILGSEHKSGLKHKNLRRGYGDVGIVKNMMKPRLAKKQKPK